jgi:transcriptional regulator with XRE-family HTH domain
MSQPTGSDFTWVEIGKRIRDWRLARGWSQQQLAAASGLSQSGVVHLEKGDTNPQLGTLRDIAAAFGKPLRELMCGPRIVEEGAGSTLQQRIRRVLDSNDRDALAALEWGVGAAELLLERRSAHASDPAPGLDSPSTEPAAESLPSELEKRKPASSGIKLCGLIGVLGFLFEVCAVAL